MTQSNGKPLSRLVQALHEKVPGEEDRNAYRAVAICGHTVKQVAADMELPPDRVQAMVERVRLWLAQIPPPVNVRALTAQHLARLEHQWQEAMNAWYRSRSKEETLKSSWEDQKQKAAPAEDDAD